MTRALSEPILCGLLAERPSPLSKAMHSAGFSYAQLPFLYVNFSVDETKEAIAAMRALGIRGLSLTIPHKERAYPLVDQLSEEAREIGAINTAIFDGATIRGDNTDWFGVLGAFDEAGARLEGSRVLLLGAGGAARAALFAVRLANVRSVTVWNRNPDRATEFARFHTISTSAADTLSDFDVVINCTPLGSKGETAYPFSLDDLSSAHTVLDMVTRETPLIEATRRSGGCAIAGVRMLLFQGLRQFELFTGESAPREAMEGALLKAYAEWVK